MSYRIVTYHAPRFLCSFARAPRLYIAEQRLAALPVARMTELFHVDERQLEALAPTCLPSRARTEWHARLDEHLKLALLVRLVQPRRLFEFGTYDGAMARTFAQCAGPDAHVWTLDLPAAEFDRHHAAFTGWFRGTDLGRAYRETPEAARITQLIGDSQTFDYRPWHGSMDLVFVDAAHDYRHAARDTRNALALARPGGWVVWHDATPQWHGVVRAIYEMRQAGKLRPIRLFQTTLAMAQVPE